MRQTLTEKLQQAFSDNNIDFNEFDELIDNLRLLEPLKSKINDFKNEYSILVANKERLTKELSENKIDVSEQSKLQNEKDDIEFNIKTLQIDLGAKTAKKQQKEQNLAKKHQLSAIIQEKQHEEELAKTLLKLLHGKAFNEFICLKYLNMVTITANEICSVLLDGKYNLIFKDGEFLVCDNFNGGEIRSASTLSGGETFLISLSLSLAISEAISVEAFSDMDFFFLDEGFGTLDQELCETVVASLYKLQSKNLKIGVISHVELLKERIKNKIIVSKDENKGSVVRIDQDL